VVVPKEVRPTDSGFSKAVLLFFRSSVRPRANGYSNTADGAPAPFSFTTGNELQTLLVEVTMTTLGYRIYGDGCSSMIGSTLMATFVAGVTSVMPPVKSL
jgi:hypothetical protein